ncbi:hypothetical protein A2767_01610 [Candidatus Roizmanbacteria bacterium RIFCSPHIGHO2_01_FULL_35_10]|uniref:DUF5678 domain-containing protein n=1 Tax=Candidatus Roizmanbacteria bacterium RIFCSPLOWO2_01_FULL_35_13 TaxID=1802055 RepID=A0A1F7IAN9_9BACT|nr:MAG: hypothetical protein A2767_01610 [Candidatus Roizmanbacteria bacterium RIFCSPHIGHO2_01_FULL_35_10]OGK40436.1 MAG: hypothetical protein A3A74_01890 [Candidatus Roizmanbacteria bacterium RIFCSPLOWO2_01_FULL_35_13]
MKNTQKMSPEFDYFIHHPLTKYEGQYVAILGKKIISSGKTATVVWNKAQKKYPNSLPTIAKIPKKEAMILLWK